MDHTQHARLLFPPLFPKVCSNLCPLNRWCYLTMSSSAICFSFCLQSFPASGSHQAAKVSYRSFSFSIRASNEYSELISFRIDWFDLPAVQGTLKESSPAPQFKSINPSVFSFLYGPTLKSIHDYWKNHSLIRWTFVGKIMSLLFNMLSRLFWAFLPGNKCLLISRLQSPSAVILEAKKIKSLTVFIVSTSLCHGVMGPDVIIWFT